MLNKYLLNVDFFACSFRMLIEPLLITTQQKMGTVYAFASRREIINIVWWIKIYEIFMICQIFKMSYQWRTIYHSLNIKNIHKSSDRKCIKMLRQLSIKSGFLEGKNKENYSLLILHNFFKKYFYYYYNSMTNAL